MMEKDCDNKVVKQMMSLGIIRGHQGSLGVKKGLLFLQKDFTQKKSIKSTKCKQATFIQIFSYAQKALKSKQATFTHKCHKK